MIKRLNKMASDPGSLQNIKISINPSNIKNKLPLKAFDAAAVKSGKCSECNYSPLKTSNDLLICPNCGQTFKAESDNICILF